MTKSTIKVLKMCPSTALCHDLLTRMPFKTCTTFFPPYNKMNLWRMSWPLFLVQWK